MLLNSMFTGPHMIWLLIIVLVLFGGKKIPELAKGLGEGIRNFKDSLKDPNAPPDDKKQA